MDLRQTLEIALIEALYKHDDLQAGIVMLALEYVKIWEAYNTAA